MYDVFKIYNTWQRNSLCSSYEFFTGYLKGVRGFERRKLQKFMSSPLIQEVVKDSKYSWREILPFHINKQPIIFKESH